jgi:DNA invertase Pin-like site-specific DNA recombinase
MPQEKPAQKKTAVAHFRTSHCKESDERTRQTARQRERAQAVQGVEIAQEFVDHGTFGEARFWQRVILHMKRKNLKFREMLAYLEKNPTDTVMITDPDRLSHNKDAAQKMIRQIEARGSKVRVLSAEPVK